MDCFGGKNPFIKMNCVFVNNSPSVQVTTSPDAVDRENEDVKVSKQEEEKKSHFCLQRIDRYNQKQNRRKK